MKPITAIVAATALLYAPFAMAQNSPSAGNEQGAAPAPRAEAPAASPNPDQPKMTDAEAKSWVNKPIYSSDDKKLGEVAAVALSTSGQISELHADIGGFLGIGETRVRVKSPDFKLLQDRVVLNVTADQAETLPKLEVN